MFQFLLRNWSKAPKFNPAFVSGRMLQFQKTGFSRIPNTATKFIDKYKGINEKCSSKPQISLHTVSIVGVLIGSFTAFRYTYMLDAQQAFTVKDRNHRQAFEAYKTLKAELNLPAKTKSMDEKEQEIFLVYTTINIKELQEQLSTMKDQQEKQLRESLAADEALQQKANILIREKDAELRELFKKDLEEKTVQTIEQTDTRLQQELNKLRENSEVEYKEKFNTLRINMIKELVERFESLQTESEDMVSYVQESLKLKHEEFLRKNTMMEENKHFVKLQDACRDFENKLISEEFVNKNWMEQLYSLEPLMQNLKEILAEKDEFICTVMHALPEKALTRGVLSEVALKQRFNDVEKVTHRLSLLHKDGPYSGTMYLLSYLRSLLTVQPSCVVTSHTDDVEEIDNADILFKARYFINEGDILQASKLLEHLKGASKQVASDWLHEAQLMTQVYLTIQILKSYATLQIHRSAAANKK